MIKRDFENPPDLHIILNGVEEIFEQTNGMPYSDNSTCYVFTGTDSDGPYTIVYYESGYAEFNDQMYKKVSTRTITPINVEELI